jgi:hypothetical protein
MYKTIGTPPNVTRSRRKPTTEMYPQARRIFSWRLSHAPLERAGRIASTCILDADATVITARTAVPKDLPVSADVLNTLDTDGPEQLPGESAQDPAEAVRKTCGGPPRPAGCCATHSPMQKDGLRPARPFHRGSGAHGLPATYELPTGYDGHDQCSRKVRSSARSRSGSRRMSISTILLRTTVNPRTANGSPRGATKIPAAPFTSTG